MSERMTKRTKPITFEYAQGVVQQYNTEHNCNYTLVCMLHAIDGDRTFKMETRQCDEFVIDTDRLYCMDYGEDGLFFFTKNTDDMVFSKDMTPADLLESDCNIVYNLESAEKSRKPVRVHPIDTGTEFAWKLIDEDDNEIVIGLKDWKTLSDYIDDLYRKKNEFLMWSFHSFIMETMCKECVKDCNGCPIADLKRMIVRRIPDYTDFD